MLQRRRSTLPSYLYLLAGLAIFLDTAAMGWLRIIPLLTLIFYITLYASSFPLLLFWLVGLLLDLITASYLGIYGAALVLTTYLLRLVDTNYLSSSAQRQWVVGGAFLLFQIIVVILHVLTGSYLALGSIPGMALIGLLSWLGLELLLRRGKERNG